MATRFINHKQVLSAYDRDGDLLEQVTVEGWDDEASWEIDLDTTDNDLYRDGDETGGKGSAKFDYSHEQYVHSALLSEKSCSVYYNGKYVGCYIHTHECEMASENA